jgi:hypothetical protein
MIWVVGKFWITTYHCKAKIPRPFKIPNSLGTLNHIKQNYKPLNTSKRHLSIRPHKYKPNSCGHASNAVRMFLSDLFQSRPRKEEIPAYAAQEVNICSVTDSAGATCKVTHGYIGEDSQSPGRGSNRDRAECKIELLSTKSWRSILFN